jgi:hypothetical protein
MSMVPSMGSGTMLAPMIDPQAMLAAHENLREWVGKALKEKRDYDKLPGTEKYVILKPGVDKLIAGFQLKASFVILSEEVDHDRLNTFDAGKWETITDPGYNERERLKAQCPGKYRSRKRRDGKYDWQEKIEETGTSLGLYRYQVQCKLSDSNGEIVAEAVGVCSSMEAKYIRSPRDAEHTILMMAMKRARTAAVTSLLGLSEIFEAEDEAPASGKSQGYEEPQSSAGYEPAAQPEGNGQGIAIKGMAGVFKAWDLLPTREKEVKETITARGLKVPDAITEAQRTKGAATVETVEAFLAWLDEAHPASNIVDVEVKE